MAIPFPASVSFAEGGGNPRSPHGTQLMQARISVEGVPDLCWDSEDVIGRGATSRGPQQQQVLKHRGPHRQYWECSSRWGSRDGELARTVAGTLELRPNINTTTARPIGRNQIGSLDRLRN